MKTITPWKKYPKEFENVFDSIAKNQRGYTSNINFTRGLPRQYPELFDDVNGFFDIARIGKRKESVIIPKIGVQVVPLPEPSSISIKSRRRKRYGIYRL